MVNYSRSPRKLLLGTIMTLVCRQACTGNKHSKSGPQTNLPSRSNSADPTTLLQEQVQGKLQIGHTALHVKHSVRNSVNSGAGVESRFHGFALRSALIVFVLYLELSGTEARSFRLEPVAIPCSLLARIHQADVS